MFNSTGLLGPQIPHTESLIDSIVRNGFAVDLSDTGTGKTFCAAAIGRELNVPVFVICPKAVLSSWSKILTLFGVKGYTIINYEKIGRGNTKWMKWRKANCPETKPGAVKVEKREIPFFKIPSKSLVILDEGHRCKGQDTTNSWMLVALTLQNYKVLVSSATAACSPLEMKAFGFLTRLHKLHDFKEFCRSYGADWLGRFGALTWDATADRSKRAMADIHHHLFNGLRCASRLRREDFGDLFPESHVVAEAFDLSDVESARIQRVYDDMEYELARLEERCENYREHIFAVLMEARRKAEMCKVPLFCEMIEDHFDEGKSVAVFCNFTDTIQAISKRLAKLKKFNGMVGFIVGGQTDKERQADIDDFQNDQKRIILAQIDAGGVGVSLHDLIGNHSRVSLISPTWKAVNLTQALGRVWRQGGKTKSLQYIVYASGCIEEQICRRVQMKINNLNALNDADLAEDVRWICEA